MTLSNEITVASNPGGSQTFTAAGSGTITFTVTITNPCWTTSIPQLIFSPAATLGVTHGLSDTQEFVRPISAVETSTRNTLVCGTYEYVVYTDQSTTVPTHPWVTIAEKANTPGTYVITADTAVDLTLMTTVSPRTYNYYVKSYLSLYTNVSTYTAKTIAITAPACSCASLAWDAPAIATPTFTVPDAGTHTLTLPNPNTAATATDATFASCYNIAPTPGCANSGSFLAGSVKYDDDVTVGGTTLPSWITFSSSGNNVQTLTITPPTGAKNGVHTLFATFTPTYGSPITYTVVQFTVTCTLASYALPTTPASPAYDLSYNIFDGPLAIDLAPEVYVETPTCGYTTTLAIVWTGT